MKKYISIIAFILLILLSIFLVWFFFIKKNPVIEQYEQKFEDKTNAINQNNEIPKEDINNNEIENNNPDGENKPPKDNNIIDNPGNQIIISSDNKVLNEQGKELLDELSKQLEDSFQTISSTTGVVDDDILDQESEIKIGE